jgi:hypothetical protein
MKQTLTSAFLFLISWQMVFGQDAPTQVNLVVVSGEGILTKTGDRVTQPIQVRVEDQYHMPIGGAAVVFTLPSGGPGGEFDKGSKTLTVMTDGMGLAAVRGLRLNDTPGRYELLVNVAYRGLTASTSIAQFSTAPNGAVTHTQHTGSSKWIWIAVIAGAAGAGGAIAASHGSSSSSSSSGGGGGGGAPISISVGSATVTHP